VRFYKGAKAEGRKGGALPAIASHFNPQRQQGRSQPGLPPPPAAGEQRAHELARYYGLASLSHSTLLQGLVRDDMHGRLGVDRWVRPRRGPPCWRVEWWQRSL
jgi:hypothetical protein